MKFKKRQPKRKKDSKRIFTYETFLAMGLDDTRENQKLYEDGKGLELLIRLPDEENENEK